MSKYCKSLSLNNVEDVGNDSKLISDDNTLPVIKLSIILTLLVLYPLVWSDLRLPPNSLTFKILEVIPKIVIKFSKPDGVPFDFNNNGKL